MGSWADTPERVERLLAAVARPNLALNYQTLDFLPESAVLKSDWKDLGCGMFNTATNTCVQIKSNY